MPLPFVFLLLSPPAQNPFDSAIAAYRARRSFAVSISLDALIDKAATQARYRLSVGLPRKVLLQKLINGKVAIIFWLDGNRFMAYDPVSNEVAVRPAPSVGTLVNQLANALGGGLEDPISVQLSPEMMAAFFSPFRNLQGWATTKSGDTLSLARITSTTRTQFDFSLSSKLLTKALITGPGSKLQWVFAYGPSPKNLAFAPPKGAKVVGTLSEHATINSQDPKARAIVDRSLIAYSRLENVAFRVSGSSGTSTEWMSGNSFHEKQARIEWAYTGKTLTVKDFAKGKTYRGTTSPAGIVTYLKALRTPMEPVMQGLLMHRNPIKGWFLPGMRVSSRGSVNLGGLISDAVELKSPSLEIELLVRRDNHLVASVVSRAKNRQGKVVSEAQRQFSYSAVNTALPASSFFLDSRNALPLSKLGK